MITETPVAGAEINSEPLSDESGTSVPDETPDGSERPMPREQRYRLELREAERQRDALAQRVDLLTRREVERIAGEHLAQGADLLGISGNSLDAYINEETGEVDADRVREDARILLADRPGLRKNAAAFDPSQGLGGRPPQKTGPQSLGQVILMS